MKSLLSMLALVVFAFTAKAEQPKYYLNDNGTVELRLANVESKVQDLEDRVTKLEKSNLPPLRSALPASAPTVTKAPATPEKLYAPFVQPATRAPIGHTHTCVNGHTWDHTMDGGSHNCPFCGSRQTTQDRFAQQVTIVPMVAAASRTNTSSNYTYTESFKASSGCANGACATGNTGWYPGKNLRRR